ncbi:duplicated orphan permease [Williamwhitmania taraxaci]|uniref:Duplicated orphan permease n=2 Tax=Williamwhitmania taraxaci TaxID=1640674 RepID=A0A1G6GVS8_9BACT|nr:duplicated orphan permease [Williamwhitmania taraxaci]
MILTNLKIAYRNLIRSKGYSFINIFGLAFGMAVTILLLLWVSFELSWDKFYPNTNNLYQVVCRQTWDGAKHPMPNLPGPLIDVLKEKYPEVKMAANVNTWGQSVLKKCDGFEQNIHINHVDPNFLKLFSIKLLRGDATTALNDPRSIVLSEKMAKVMFENDDPIGKILTIDNKTALKVTGIMENPAENTILKFSCLVPFELLRMDNEGLRTSWGNHSYFGFAEVNEGVNVDSLNKKLNNFFVNHVEKTDSLRSLFLFPVSKVHLYFFDGSEKVMKQVKLFSIIAIFILLIACFNFMNLSTARAAKRAKEIGLKKTVGASRGRLIAQFMGESLLVTFISMNFALIFAKLLLPYFNSMMDRNLQFDYSSVQFWLLIVGVTLVTGILSGAYPAFYLTKFRPINVLKGNTSRGKGGARFREVLVVLQYSLSIALVVCTLVVSLQIRYLQKMDMGMDIHNVVSVPLTGTFREKHDVIRQQLLEDPSIQSVSYGAHMPCNVYYNGWGNEWEGKDPNYNPLVSYTIGDYNFLKTFKIQMAEGRYFSEEFEKSDSTAIVINQTFAKMVSKGSVIGMIIKNNGTNYHIVGVVKDFNFTHISNKIGPLMMYSSGGSLDYMFVRVNPNNKGKANATIQRVCSLNNPDFPVNSIFVDDYLSYMYKGDQKSMTILLYFSVLALIISSLGLIGLASFMAEERTKEIGVRKIMGASVTSLVSLFSYDFTKWVLLSNIIALPLAWYFMKGWLQGFAYRIPMPWWVFAAVAAFVFVIAFLTVSYQSYRAASQNPVISIKYE